MNFTFRLLICFAICISCQQEEPKTLEDLVDMDLVIYFERFAEEATLRGYRIDWQVEEINARLTEIEEDAVGQCLTYASDKRQINIDQKYWDRNRDIDREFLVFHELGHCLLSRSHKDNASVSGTCVSIMNSGQGLCTKNYNLNTRAEFLDELFSD